MSKDEGLIHHLVSVRYRVTGEGNFKTTVYSFDDVDSEELADAVLASTTAQLPLQLANFRSQGMQIEFRVEELDETFTLDRIVAYIKPTATGYPQ
jgi:hypothetical protein